jgi:uncharacterized protein YxjI
MQLDEYRKMYALEENFWWYRGMLRVTRKILGQYLQPGSDIRILDAQGQVIVINRLWKQTN